MILLFCSSNKTFYINKLPNIETNLYSWNNFMVTEMLDSVVNTLFSIFASVFMNDISLQFYFIFLYYFYQI